MQKNLIGLLGLCVVTCLVLPLPEAPGQGEKDGNPAEVTEVTIEGAERSQEREFRITWRSSGLRKGRHALHLPGAGDWPKARVASATVSVEVKENDIYSLSEVRSVRLSEQKIDVYLRDDYRRGLKMFLDIEFAN